MNMTDLEADLLIANAEIKKLKEENEQLQSFIASELLPGLVESFPRLVDGLVAYLEALIEDKRSLEGDQDG